MVPVSVVVITFNEEDNIERCLLSVQDVADEIVVVDSLSADRTKEICLRLGVKFIEQPFLGYVEQKNKALEYCQYSHVLSLDADEALSDQLKASILKAKENWIFDGYEFNRLTNYCGKWIRHTDWYPDRKLRLFDKRKGKWDGQLIHEKVIMNEGSEVSLLQGDLFHYSFPSIDHHLEVVEKFTTIMAREGFEKKKKVGWMSLLFSPLWKFIKSYFVKKGFLDGYYGFVVCMISAHATFIKYVKIKELINNEKMKGMKK
jgi:glycosyltransferase involved in cell wall biosynthesis